MRWEQSKGWIKEPTGAERRRFARKAVFKTAIVFPVLEEATLAIDNVSRNGVSGTCPLSLHLRQAVHIHFADQPFLAAEVRWVSGQRCGLLMEEPLLLPSLRELTPDFAPPELVTPEFSPPEFTTVDARETRVAVKLSATIVTSEPMMAAKVRNLSEGGMMIELDTPIAEGQLLLVRARGQQTIAARVQWSSKSLAGLAFQQAA